MYLKENVRDILKLKRISYKTIGCITSKGTIYIPLVTAIYNYMEVSQAEFNN